MNASAHLFPWFFAALPAWLGAEQLTALWRTNPWRFNVWELHPMLVHFPIALLLCGVAVELWAMRRPRETLTRAGAGLLLAGAVSGWLTALAGLLAYFTVRAHTEEAHVWMWWHLGFAATTMLLFTWVAVVRWRRRMRPSTGGQWLASLIGALLLSVTGWLGGLIVYHGGAGIEPALLSQEIRGGHSHGGSEGDQHEQGSEQPARERRAQGHDSHGANAEQPKNATHPTITPPPRKSNTRSEHKE